MFKIFRNTILPALCCLCALLATTACSDDTAGMGDKPAVSDNMFKVYVDDEDGNIVHFSFTAAKLSPYWEIELPGGIQTYSDRDFTLTMSRGVYTGYLTAYGRGGRSERYQFSFEVTALDPSYRLLCGKDDDKVWVWDRYGEAIDAATQRIFGYLWGEPWQKNSWFNPTADLEAYGILDSKIAFRNEGAFIFTPDADGKVWVDGGGWGDVEKAGKASWTPTGNESWAFTESAGKRYIKFGGGAFPGLIADPAGIDAEYEIVELTDTRLCLRWWRGEGDGIEFNFCPEGYVGETPTPPSEPEPPTPPAPVTDIIPLPAGAPEYALLTAHPWVADSKYGYLYEVEDLYDTPTQALDEVLTFKADGSMTLDSDGDVYADAGNGHFPYTPSGSESYVLGKNDAGQLCVQFKGGGFPILRATEEVDQVHEVRELSANRLKLFWSYGDGGGLLIILVAKDGSAEPPTPPVVDPDPVEPDPADPTAVILTAHPWKLKGVSTPEAGFYDIGTCADEVLYLSADGSMTLESDGTVFDNDEGPHAYTPSGKESWKLVESDGMKAIKFDGGGFPIVLANTEAINGTYTITELTSDACTLSVPYWGSVFNIHLIKK
ncbi:MAG: hypothetical protein NC210_03790 [[Clostridium] fimetarium]|nr:hypothetical protein [Alistipes timonensis]MCM1405526.1 hypothetical protein [[Clostridium] fimetarium]